MNRPFRSLMPLSIAFSGFMAGCAADHARHAEPVSSVTSTTSSKVSSRHQASFTWPVPKGWRSETIPFPLEFAPDLGYRGVEELRFAPKFFDPKSPTYFTYSFVWLLEEDSAPTLSARKLSSDLGVYFAGLAHAVAPSKFDRTAHDARIEQDRDGTFHGVVRTVDAFGDGHAITLNTVGETVRCGARRGILISLSPHPRTDEAIWTTLTDQRRQFRCDER